MTFDKAVVIGLQQTSILQSSVQKGRSQDDRKREEPRPSSLSPPVVVGLPAVIDAPRQTEHPHQDFDRAARCAVALLSGGVSTHAFIKAWSDWARYLSRAPVRQMELAEHAQRSLLKLMALATSPGGAPPSFPETL